MNNIPMVKLPSQGAAYKAWRTQAKKELRNLIGSKSHAVSAKTKSKVDLASGVVVRQHALSVGKEWTVPCTEITPQNAKSTMLVLADAGRKSISADAIQTLLDQGHRVLAVDPFYFGESKISQRNFLFALTVSTVGERPIGILANQLNAIAGWARKTFKSEVVDVTSFGPRTSLMSRVAAATDTAVSAYHTHEEFDSLRDVIKQDITVNNQPELFCFGLLQQCDISHLKLMARRP